MFEEGLIIKRLLLLLLAGLLVLTLLGCTASEKEEETSFTGTILEKTESGLLVEPKEGSAELNSADKISVSLKDAVLLNSQGEEISLDDFEVGKEVEITYTGGIAESYPAQIHNCLKVKLLD